jgi:hypothetical protein
LSGGSGLQLNVLTENVEDRRIWGKVKKRAGKSEQEGLDCKEIK